MISFTSIKSVAVMLAGCVAVVAGQLPDDMQRELNQNLAEQARIQRMREHQQRLAASRQAKSPHHQVTPAPSQARAGAPTHDPNNYSFQQVSPPIQYSYYQPYGDTGASQQPVASQGANGVQQQQQQVAPANFDFNSLSLDLPQPQAQVSPRRSSGAGGATGVPMSPSFTGAGGLPVMQPVAAAQVSGQPVQQGPPLTEADFRDITGGENYGAPAGGEDFGGLAGGGGGQQRQDNTDAQLGEFGFPDPTAARNQGQASQGPVPDFDPFARTSASGGRSDANGDSDFGNLVGMMNEGSPRGSGQRSQPSEFDFALQPSSSEHGGNQRTASGGAPPGSLQSLLGAGFPGLGQETSPAQQSEGRAGDDGSSDIADNLGDRSDQFPDAGNLGGAEGGDFEQPAGQDQDFNYAAAASQQPVSVPYPDAAPQPVGTLWALTQPQSLTQTRYNALPDKGTYQDYPAYQVDSSGSISEVTQVVDETPPARAPGLGRYGVPSPSQLAPGNRPIAGRPYDYSSAPTFQ